jgi:hypothetical protein
MKVERREHIDWESVPMTLHAERDLSDEELDKVRQLLKTWPEEKAPPRDFGGSSPEPRWEDSPDRKTLRFYWEKWFPEAWFEPLASELAAALPSGRGTTRRRSR